jgi:hypothetical protein
MRRATASDYLGKSFGSFTILGKIAHGREGIRYVLSAPRRLDDLFESMLNRAFEGKV